MPDTPQELVRIGPFEGLDQTTDPEQVAPTNGVVVSNFTPNRTYGALSMSRGRQSVPTLFTGPLLNITLFLSTPTLYGVGYSQGLLQFTTLAAFNTAPANATNVTLPAGVVLTTTNMRFAPYAGYLFCSGGGTDQPIKLSLPTVQSTNWQINPSTTAPTYAAGGAGALLGVYSWRYTYYNSVTGQESSPSPTLLNQTVTSTSANITVAASADAQTTNINLYRIGGTSASWIQTAQSANVAGVINDNVADSALTGAALVLHRDPPANFQAICTHKDRTWGFGYSATYPWTFGGGNAYVTTAAQPADLWFTRFGEPWSFDAVNNVIPIGREALGDQAVGLCSIGSVLVLMKTMTTWIVYGDSEQDFRAIKVADIGCIEQRTIATGYGMCFWLAESGVVMFDGSTPQNISNGNPQDGGIKQQLGAYLRSSTPANWRGSISGQTYYLTNAVLGVTYAYSIYQKKWYNVGFQSSFLAAMQELNATPVGLPNGPVFFGVNPVGTGLDQWMGREGDSYINPLTTWVTGNLDCGHPEQRKDFRYASVKIPPSDPNNAIAVSFYCDGVLIAAPVFNPRPVGSIASSGSAYYRVSFPPTATGHTITIQVVMSIANQTPPILSEIRVFGFMKQLLPPVSYLPNGST